MQVMEPVGNDFIISFPKINLNDNSDNLSRLFPKEYETFLKKMRKWKHKRSLAEYEHASYSTGFKGLVLNTSIKQQMYFLAGTSSVGTGTGLITIFQGYTIAGSGIATISITAGFIFSCLIPKIFNDTLANKERLERRIEVVNSKLATLQDTLEIVEAGLSFLIAYKSFKLEPNEPSLKNLFYLFENIKSTFDIKTKNNLNLKQKFTDLNIFVLNPLGRYSLMDRTAHLCQGVMQEAWKVLKESLLKGDLPKAFKFPSNSNTESGSLVELPKCLEFQVRFDELGEIDIEEHLTTLFKKALIM